MIDKVATYIKKWNMIKEGDTIIVGVSGGADSVCLLHMLHMLQEKICFTVIVAHIEHGIRGEESVLDSQFVEKLSKEYNLKYRKYSYEVRGIAKEYHLSEEEAGRKVRYESFERASQEFGANKIAVAHNQEDNAETMLMNLFRGSGLQGIGGILPVRQEIIRPLLCLSRKEIEDYLAEKGISYRTDATNLLEEYTRNKLRLRMFPYITGEINQQAVAHMAQTAELMQETYEFVQKQTQEAFEKCAKYEEKKVELFIEPLLKEEVFIQKQVIRLAIEVLLKQLRDITWVHIKSVYQLLEKQVNKSVDLPFSLVAHRGYKSILIQTKSKKEKQRDLDIRVQVPGIYQIEDQKIELNFSIIKVQKESEENIIILEKMYTKWLDCDRINSNLQLRHRHPGDYLTVNAQNGTKKLKDYFIEQKIPQQERGNIVLLADGSHILWVIGHRISEYYKISNTTKNILKVQANGGNIHERKD